MLLETNLQVAPFTADSKITGDKLVFMIDGDAKEGDRPKYDKQQKAFLCGFASHTPPGGKGGEMIKPIFRDDFCTWGHIIENGGKIKWKIIPMYFIPHGSGIVGLTDTSRYKFNPQPVNTKGSIISARMKTAQVKSVLQPTATEESVNDVAQPTDPVADTNGPTDDFVIGGDMGFSGAEPTESTELSPEDTNSLTKPLTEGDFGEDVKQEDVKAKENGDDW
jgi:hypothetical protein